MMQYPSLERPTYNRFEDYNCASDGLYKRV